MASLLKATLAAALVYEAKAMAQCSEIVLDDFTNCIATVNQTSDIASTVITKCDEGTYFCCSYGIPGFGPDVKCEGAASSIDSNLYWMTYNAVQSPNCLTRTDDLFYAYSDLPFQRTFASRYAYATDVQVSYRVQDGTESLSVAWGTETFADDDCSYNITLLVYPDLS
jgi:hypothetical protein